MEVTVSNGIWHYCVMGRRFLTWRSSFANSQIGVSQISFEIGLVGLPVQNCFLFTINYKNCHHFFLILFLLFDNWDYLLVYYGNRQFRAGLVYSHLQDSM